ncbi:Tectonin beta-propeller repeat containing 2 [Parelaphostrongylus tenuis]|uniref:Tectonin beta-propeller repeat containing 2 n=1 Tax=Parelaphostrongylus tenuis TaxID=148309 RepID=A0AAD5WJ79_PARTN|nr:Tectonin beta-propeller repeat containing 2 [Parelaphostrongylus tenuis]
MNVVPNAKTNEEKNGEAGDSVQVFHDDVVGISSRIPETFDFGTVSVELTCIASSSAYIILGSGCGTLFVYNRRLAKFARPLRTNSFEAVTCIHHLHLLDDFVAVGHNTGTLIVMRLPSGREGASTSLSQCIDENSHRHSPIINLQWNSDASKVVSADCYGTVILSTVMFDTCEFYHSYLFEGQSPVLGLGFLGKSIVIDDGLQIVMVDVEPPHASQVVCDRGNRAVILSVRCTDLFVYIVEKTRICIYPTSFLEFDTIEAIEIVHGSGSFQCVEWNECSNKIAILTSGGVFVMYCVANKQVLWKASINNEYHSIGNFCVDPDDSILYISKPRNLYRIGVSSIAESLVNQETDSSFSALFSSPRKLISTGAHRVTQKGAFLLNSAINTAKDITLSSGVSNLLGDAFDMAIVKEDIGHLIHNVRDGFVEHEYFQVGEEAITGSVESSQSNSVGELQTNIVEEHPVDVFVQRKEKITVRKIEEDRSQETRTSERSPNDSLSIDEDHILTLRKEVLGNSVVNTNPVEPGTSVDSTSTHIAGDDSHISGGSHETSSDHHASPFQMSRSSLDVQCNSSLCNEDDPRDPPELSDVKTSVVDSSYSSKKEQGAESVTLAYEYLLQQNTSNPPISSSEICPGDRLESIRVNEDVGEPSYKNVVLSDQADVWSKVFLPYTAKSFAVGSRHLVLCHKKKRPRFIALDDLGSKKPNWQVAKWSAENIAMNDDESLIWRVSHRIGWCATEPLSTCTRFEEYASDGGGVTEVSVGANVAWYLTKTGVSLQMELPDKAIFSRVDRDWPLKSISVSEGAIWAIRSDTGGLIVRVGLARCRMGLDWVEIVPEGASKLVSVCVFDTYGFALDDSGHLWLSAGVDEHHPYGLSDAFYKVCTPLIDVRTAPIETWTIRASSAGLFLCVGKVMFISRSAVSGHKFLEEVPKTFGILDNFSLISAGAFLGGNGPLYLCRQNSEIFLYRSTRRNFITINTPQGSSAIVSLCAVPGKLSVINSSGRVFHSDGESSFWEEETNLCGPVCSLAHGKLGSWAIGCDGAILSKPDGVNFWSVIPPPSGADVVPTQVFSSPNGIYVWLLAGGRGWARASISTKNLSGVKWIETYHTSELSTLAVGNNVVWATDSNNVLLRLRGLAAGNPAGNYWRPISFETFRAISIDGQSELWAINVDNRLVRHRSALYVPQRLNVCDSMDPFEVI